jgi:signal peptidase I
VSLEPPGGAESGSHRAATTAGTGPVDTEVAATPGAPEVRTGPKHARRDEPAEGGDGEGAAPTRRRRSASRWIAEWAIIVIVAVVVAFLVRTYVAQTFFVPSTSMYPTLKAGDRIVVNKLAFDYGSIDRGDIVVFKTPPAEHCGGPRVPDLVKRVIGLPGETISARNGHVYITGKVLNQPWLPKVKSTYTSNFGPDKIPKGDYFMMGDNRVASCDSRMWGPVKRSYIVGKVDLILWPFSQFRFF